MSRPITIAWLLLAAVLPAADPDPRSLKDPFGRPRPHGEPVKGAFVGLSAGRTDLFFGQPLLIDLFAVPVTEKGPYVNPQTTGPSNVRWEMSDAAGQPVPVRVTPAGGNGFSHFIYLQPPPGHAVGHSWKPGTYRIRATVEQAGDAAAPNRVVGTFRTNVLTLTVAEPGAPLDRLVLDAATRERIDKLIAALDAPAAADRAAAEKALAAEPDPAVLLRLDDALASASAEAGPRLRAALKEHDDRLRRAASGPPFVGPRNDFWLWVGGLVPKVSERLRKRIEFPEAGWRTAAAGSAPVDVPQGRPLTAAEAAKLRDDLGHADPWVRMLAVRSVPKGAPAEVRADLIKLLDDPYVEWTAGPGDPAQYPPIRYAVLAAAARLGAEMLDPLLAYAARDENRAYRGLVAATLGQMGPDPKAREFLRGMIRSGRADEQSAAQQAATAWGKEGVDLQREVVATAGMTVHARGAAVAALGHFGDPAADGPTIHKLLTDPQLSLQMVAARALGEIKYKEALPDLERIARDPTVNQNIRYGAIDGVLAMSDEKAGNQLLMDLTDPKIGGRVRGFAFTRLGRRKVTAALPVLLDALADEDWYTRVMADGALRGLSERWEGVGFDARSPAPAKWREYWAAKGK